ncbi:Xaa-Pro peptidase family protein [Phytohabitans sp. ZYX-F-186]|uniref:Xaa-Pro peptidase family protein n=1 Tax=Phytohabitans maris TaxID=3071409 RepID=A0ABU0ZSY4_9ACTN|nr:Xaa-Pro peptidase family protein [Phytohabitans sp. ZYX-F-186]MDQ7910107.1 Xaa-Pro peptidase family protein [Phytohabitans sp. ZYX-F-186]
MSTTHKIIRYEHELHREDYPWPTFSAAEFARRHDLVRGFLADNDLDCLLISGTCALWERGWANVRWLSNFIGTMELDAYVIFPREGEPTLAILGLNARLPDRIARSVIPDVRGALNTSVIVVERLRELGLESGRIGIVRPAPWLSIPADHHAALAEAFPRARFAEFSDEFWKLRLVLSDEELACLEEAGRIGDCAVQAVIDNLRPGMAERDLFAIIYDTFAREGGEIPTMVLAASESMYHPVSGFQRPRPIDRTVATGDVLLLELGAREAHGYEAQTGKPIIFGPPSPECEDLLDVMFTAYQQVVAALKPGCTAKELRAAGQVIVDRGYQIVAPLVHGVFNPIDAGPFVGTSHRPDKDIVLEPNMACCVEIHPCTADVRRGVFIGDTFVITPDGARSVNKLPPVLTQL